MWTAFSSSATNSLLDWSLGFALATPEHSPICLQTISVKLSLYALGHCLARKWIFSQVIVFLHTSEVVFQGFPIFWCLHFTLYHYKLSRACCWEAPPIHDAATSILQGGSVFVVMCTVWCLPNTASSLMAIKLHFGLIRPNNLPPADLGVSHMPFGELWLRLNELSSLCHAPIKFLLVKNPGYSIVCRVSPISAAEAFNSFRVVIGVLVASLTSFLLARSVSLWGRPALGRLHIYHIPSIS